MQKFSFCLYLFIIDTGFQYDQHPRRVYFRLWVQKASRFAVTPAPLHAQCLAPIHRSFYISMLHESNDMALVDCSFAVNKEVPESHHKEKNVYVSENIYVDENFFALYSYVR